MKKSRCMKKCRRAAAVLLAVILALSGAAVSAEGEWKCPDCGTGNTGNYCTKCGIEKPGDIVCSECGARYAFDSGVQYCGNCGERIRNRIRFEGGGFDTAEAAILWWLEGLKDLDFEKMLGAFAWETMVSRYDTEGQIRNRGIYSVYSAPRMPSGSEKIAEVNVYAARAVIINSICTSLDASLQDGRYASSSPWFHTDEEVEEFLGLYGDERIEKLSHMKNIRIIDPAEILKAQGLGTRSLPILIDQVNAGYRADELRIAAVIADLDDEELFCAPTAARYGDRWYLVSCSSLLHSLLRLRADSDAFVFGKDIMKNLVLATLPPATPEPEIGHTPMPETTPAPTEEPEK